MTTTTITNAQIKALRSEAGLAGDRETRELCDRALDGDEAARAECERAIKAARAMEDEEELTAQLIHGGWTVVDESGQRFWPDVPCATGADAIEAARDGKGEWVY